MKYRGEYARATWHGLQVATLVATSGWIPDVLVPVPLHPHRLRQRGYNQSEKLAEAAGLTLGIEVVGAIRRDRDTPQQTTLGMDDRVANVSGAFSSVMTCAGKRIVLIDDVTTTRATLLECARVCWDSGATSVRAVTLATEV